MYKLVEHLLNGGGSVTLNKGFGLIQNPLQIIDEADPIPDGYRDISTIEFWNLPVCREYAKSQGYDYLWINDRIVDAAINQIPDNIPEYIDPALVPGLTAGTVVKVADNATNDFSGQDGNYAIYQADDSWLFLAPRLYAYEAASLEQKEILARQIIGAPQQFLNNFSRTDISNWFADHHALATEAREARIIFAATYLRFEIPEQVPLALAATLNNPISPISNLYFAYYKMGLMGSLEDLEGSVGILDWVLSRSVFDGQGLLDIGATPLTPGLTLEAMADELYNLLYRGIKPSGEVVV